MPSLPKGLGWGKGRDVLLPSSIRAIGSSPLPGQAEPGLCLQPFSLDRLMLPWLSARLCCTEGLGYQWDLMLLPPRATRKACRPPSSVLAGADLAGAGLCLDPGRARGMLGRGWGSRLWLSLLCVTRALVGYRNFA
jgi:hypothetical protein